MANILDVSVFQKGTGCISIGKLSPDMVTFLTEKAPHLSGLLNSNTDILFWKDRIKHTELHKNDFISDNEFYVSASGALSYRTMYPVTDAQLTNYIAKGRAWVWNKKD